MNWSVIAILAACLLSRTLAQCPTNSLLPNLQTYLVTVSSDANSTIKTNPNSQYKCYTLSLSSPTPSVPNIAIAMTQLDQRRGMSMMFSVRVQKDKVSNTQIPLLIYSNSREANWTLISFTVAAEARSEVQFGSFLVDTVELSSCQNQTADSATTIVYRNLPQNYSQGSLVRVFLNGLAINKFGNNNQRVSLNISNPRVDSGNLLFILSKRAGANVDLVYVSYFIYDQRVGVIQISDTVVSRSNIYSPGSFLLNADPSMSDKQFLYGVTGFEMERVISVSLVVRDNKTATISSPSTQMIRELSVVVLLFSRPLLEYCSGCPGTTIQGTLCVGQSQPQCSPDSVFFFGACRACPPFTVPTPNKTMCMYCPFNSRIVDYQCVCNPGFVNVSGACVRMNCDNGIAVNGSCICRSGFYKANNMCTMCPLGSMYNGTNCARVTVCPANSIWQFPGMCVCQSGFIMYNGQCYPCLREAVAYDGSRCLCANGSECNSQNCPQGQVRINGTCICQQGSIAQPGGICRPCPTTTIPKQYNVCQCPSGQTFSQTFWACVLNLPLNSNIPSTSNTTNTTTTDGDRVISCPPESRWNGTTCVCSPGKYFINGTCQSCPANGGWDGSRCVCMSGFNLVNNTCIQCGNNSFFNGTQCVCNQGFFSSQNSPCQPCDSSCGNCSGPSPNQCLTCVNVSFTLKNGICSRGNCQATFFFNPNSMQCERCAPFCSECTATDKCNTCIQGFNVTVGVCLQICGDGKRFTLACDDGNNRNGDGCSANCTIEAGWDCRGGSSSTRDTCVSFKPTRTIITPRGQVHQIGKITVGLRLNYIPPELLANNCASCSNIIKVNQISGNSVGQVTVNYIPNSQYSYNVVLDFGAQEPIPAFKIAAAINPAMASFYQGIDTSQVVELNIDPSLLAIEDDIGTLSLPDSP